MHDYKNCLCYLKKKNKKTNFAFNNRVAPENTFSIFFFFWPHSHRFHTTLISYTLIVLLLFFLTADFQM